MNGRYDTYKSDALSSYFKSLRECAPLAREEELELARRYRETGDEEAAKRLIQSNLRAVVKIVAPYRRSGVGFSELIQEGNLGLIQAVKRFDHTRNVRLVTYASWWIRAYVQRYLQQRQARKASFLEVEDAQSSLPEGGTYYKSHKGDVHLQVQEVALDRLISTDSTHRFSELIIDEGDDQETQYIDRELILKRRMWLKGAVESLDPQEKEVIRSRYLRKRPLTLKEIGTDLQLSRQRIHQIESKACVKLREALHQGPAFSLA